MHVGETEYFEGWMMMKFEKRKKILFQGLMLFEGSKNVEIHAYVLNEMAFICRFIGC